MGSRRWLRGLVVGLGVTVFVSGCGGRLAPEQPIELEPGDPSPMQPLPQQPTSPPIARPTPTDPVLPPPLPPTPTQKPEPEPEPKDPPKPKDPTPNLPEPKPEPQDPKPPLPEESPHLKDPITIGVFPSASTADVNNAIDRLREALGPLASVAEIDLNASFAKNDVVVLASSWAQYDYARVQGWAPAITAYVDDGHGLLIFQPNPFGFPGDALSIDLFGGSVSVFNGYLLGEPVAMTQSHPIVDGLLASELPFPTDQIFSASAEWTVLARGLGSGGGSLAVSSRGKGRIVVDTDNPVVRDRKPAGHSDRLIAHVVEWLHFKR